MKRNIASMCGNESAIADFKDFVMTTLRYPEPERKRYLVPSCAHYRTNAEERVL